MSSNKIVTVYDKNKRELKPCTHKRATKLVSRECAKWVGYNQVKLLINGEDRKKLKERIIRRDNMVCYICDSKIPLEENPTIDHVVPKSSGGRDIMDNLKCCCKLCNDDKSDMRLGDYVKHMRKNPGKYPHMSESKLDELEAI